MARAQDDLKFLFADGKLDLLSTPYAERIKDSKLFTYLTICGSVPAFLATLTLDLFEKQTMT